MMLSPTAVILIAAAFLVAHILSVVFKPGLRSIPGPWLAKITNLYRVRLIRKGKYSYDLVELHRKYGPAVRVGPDCVSLTDRRVVEEIYGLRNSYPKSDWVKSSQTLFQGKEVPALMTTMDKEYHLALKRSVASAYSVSTILGYENSVEETVRYFIQRLVEVFADSGNTCPLHHWLQWYAYDVIGVITMSQRMGLLREAHDIDNMLGEIKEEGEYRAQGAVMPFIDWLCRKNPIARHLTTPTHSIMVRARAMLEERLSQSEKPDLEAANRDFISRFLEAKEKHPDLLNNRNMMGFVGSNLQAGSDTTAIALRTIMYLLMKNPEMLARMREEIEASGFSHPISFQDAFNNLPYVGAVISEAIRYFPPFALQLERFVPDGPGLELPDGTVLPAGTKVAMFGYTYHLNEEIFGKDAETFNPDRWLQQPGESEDDFRERVRVMKASDMSFGHGQRRCVGVHVAELQIYKLVPALVSLLDIELVDPQKKWHVEQRFFALQSGIDVKIKRREPAYSANEWIQEPAAD